MKYLLLIVIAFGWLTVTGQVDTWSYRGEFPATARDNAIGFTINGKVYVGMGTDYFTGPASFNDLWEYDPTTGVWTQRASLPGSPRSGAVGFSIDQKGYVVAGYNIGPGTFLLDVWEYDPALDTWTQKADAPFSARTNAVGFSIGSKGYVGTGQQFGFEFEDFYEYDPTIDQWTQMANFPGFARQRMVGFSLGNKGYVGTGFKSPFNLTDEFWEFDPVLNSWTQKADFGGGVRTDAIGVALFNKGYIGGGYNDVSSKVDFWAYNSSTDSWSQKTDIPVQRYSPVSGAANSKIFVATGNTFDNGFWEYNPRTPIINSFTPTTGLVGADITINGENFNDWDPANNIVTFNGVQATVQSATLTTLQVRVPSGASTGPITVSVFGEEGISTSPFTVIYQPPRIYAISSAQGQAGSSITIYGDNFDPLPAGNKVLFGGVRANVVTASPTELSVEVPAGANYGPISVLSHGLIAYSHQNFVLTFPAGTISYSSEIQHPTFGGPNFVSSGDLDGDGALDLAVVTQFFNKIDLLRNTSSGPGLVSFAVDGGLPISFPPTVALGDIDGDGKLDAVAVNGSANTVSVFRNSATGPGSISFEGAANFSTDNIPLGVAIRDLDYDGRPDLAVTTQANTVSVFRNTGTGPGTISFAPKVDFGTGQAPVSPQISDMDGDGAPDLIVANINNNTISVFRNTSGGPGSISFSRIDLATGFSSIPGSLAIGDLDNDGKHEIAVVNEGNATAAVFRNQGFPGSISFAARIDFTVGSFPKSVAIADLNGDGRPDMAVTNSNGKTISVFRNTSTAIGTVSFAPKVDLAVDSNPFGLSLADMDRDGKPDLVVTKPFSSTVSVLTNRVPPPQTVTTADSLALASLYQSTNGPGWTNRANWLSGSVNTWHGVTVSAGRVQSLSLSGNNLIGSLPPNLGDLTGLISLDLSANSISGSVPASIGGLALVSDLNLSNNSLAGSLPPGIANLTQLTSLRLNKNQLSGDIPTGLGSFVGLVTVALEENHFTSLPAFASTAIAQLSVGTNDLTFEDLEPNMGKSGFSYAPQGEIPGLAPKEIYQIQTLTLGYALGGTANQYQWSKDGVAIAGATSNPFVKPNSLPSDAGSYTLQVTNSLVPGLVLTTGPISVTVLPVATGFPFQPTNGPINSLAIDPITETLYFGGLFSLVNLPVTGPFVPVDKTNGLPQVGFPKVNGGVRRIVPDGTGGFIVTGSFTSIGGISRNTLAQVDGAGNVTAWNPNPNGGGVNDVAVEGNTVYVSGGFTSIGGVSRQGLAAIDLTTGATLNWDPAGVLAGASIYSIAVGSGQLYVVGQFTGSFGGLTRNHAAALDLTTGALTSWNPNVGNEGIGGNKGVLCIHYDGTKVFLGGFFERVGGVGRVNVAAVDPISGGLLGWNAGLYLDFIYTSVTSMTKVGNTLYLAGTFRQIVGQGRQGFAAVDATTGALTGWNPGRVDTSNGAVSLIESAGTIYAAGSSFFLAGPSGNQFRTGIAAIDAATGLVTPWNPNPNANVNALGVVGSSILMGGGFNTVGGMPRSNLAGLDINTGIINEWNPAPDGVVNTLAYDNGLVYVGGAFNTIGGQSRSKLAAVGATTGVSTNWNPSPTPAASSIIYSIAVAGNLVYAGGFFTSIGGQSRNRIAALDMVTGAASSWNPNSNQNIRSISIGQAAIYAGGDFTSIGGQSRRFLAALDQVTGSASPWNPDPFGGVATVFASCNTIYVGGTFFTSIGGQPRNRLAAIDAGTGLASSWNPNPTGGAFGSTTVLALAKSGNIVYAGGDFYAMGGQTRNYVAAIDALTGTPTTWDPNANGVVKAILTHEDKVYIAGDFSTLAMPSGWTGMTNGFIAKLDGNTASIPTITSFSPSGGLPGTTVTISGTNFDLTPSNNTVTLNGTPALVLASNTNSIDIQVPVGATTGRIIVTVSCTSAMSPSDFTVGSGTISISPQPLSSSVCDGNSATMSVGASGTTNISYQWQKFDGSAYNNINDGAGYSGTGSPTLSINTSGNFGAGDYRCKVSGDLAADAFSSTATLTINAIPGAPTTPLDGTSCGPGAVTVSVAGAAAGQYRWYTAATGGTAIAGEQAASYTIPLLGVTTTYYAALNIASCESTTRTPVTAAILNVPATAGAVPNFHCGPGTIAIGATGESNGNYRWYTLSTGGSPIAGEVNSVYSPTISATTSYFVTLHNGSCESISRTEVVATINPIPGAPVTVPGSNCGAGVVNLGATGGTDGQYRWYNVSTGGTAIVGEVSSAFSTPSISATTIYYVTIDNGTCESTPRTPVVATVNSIPAAPGGIDGSNCGAGVVTLGATGGVNGQYRWYNVSTGGTAIVGEVNSAFSTPSISATTIYYVTIDNGTCESIVRTPVVATVSSIPAAPGGIDGSNCGTGAITLGATGGVNGQYRWYTNSTGGASIAGEVNSTYNTPSISSTTSYYVTINDGICESSPRTAVMATINSIPTDPVTPTVNGPFCSGATFTFTTSGASPGEYRWYTVASGGTPVASEFNGSYSVALTTSSTHTYYVSKSILGCESPRQSATATVIPLPAPPNATNPPAVCSGSTVTLTASGTTNGNYRWYDGSVLISGEVNSAFTTPTLSVNRTYGAAIYDGICESAVTPILASVQICSPPVITTNVSAAFLPTVIRIDLAPLLSDPENNLNLASIQIISALPSGATATIEGTELVINYNGIPFPGNETIVLQVCDLTGLCTQETLTINLSSEIGIFNAMSPNSDGKNETFFIENIDLLPDTQKNKVTIFNRWGSVVFETTNYNNTTNVFKGIGNDGSELPPGTYYYSIEFSSGAPKRTGFISLRK